MSLTINSANNRLTSPHIAFFKLENSQFQSSGNEDNTSQLSNEDMPSNKQYSVGSTVDSPLLSTHKRFTSSISDEEESQQFLQEEKCSDYHQQGYCLKGVECQFSHQKDYVIKYKCRMQRMIQHFPQLSISWQRKRFTSFLQGA